MVAFFASKGIALSKISDYNWELAEPALKAEHQAPTINRNSVFETDSCLRDFAESFGGFSGDKLPMACPYLYYWWRSFGVLDIGAKRIVRVFS